MQFIFLLITKKWNNPERTFLKINSMRPHLNWVWVSSVCTQVTQKWQRSSLCPSKRGAEHSWVPRQLPVSTLSFWWLSSKTTVTEDVTVPGYVVWDASQWCCCQRRVTQHILKTGLYCNLTTPNIFKIIVNSWKSWASWSFISHLQLLSRLWLKFCHMFVLFLWETLSVAVFSILLNQLRHHIINASKNWGSVAFMVNCILNFQCAVFTFQASLHVSLQILILHVRRDYWVCLLGPLWRTSLYSTVIMQLGCKGANDVSA